MAERAQQRQQPEFVAEWHRVQWRKSNVVLAADGSTILYPSNWQPCPQCGQEQPPEDWYPATVRDHPFQRHAEASEEENDEICVCGYHESYHRPHDCVKDAYEMMPCACSGGQPWSCCANVHARQEQFLYQRLANVLRAAAEPASSGSPSTPDQRRTPRP